MNDDDLRGKLEEVLRDGVAYGEFHVTYFTLRHSKWITGALMPVIREALADAWDDGAEAAYEWQIGVTGKPDNPWREDD